MSRWDYECHWQTRWRDSGLNVSARHPERPKYFILELPPFANGRMHMGHLRNYTLGDAIARHRRRTGHDVLYTSGYDAFGLPNENAAREAGVTPLDLVERNMDEMTRVFLRLGFSHDRARTISDHEPRYFKWVQKVFLRLHAAGLIHRRRCLVNWCAGCRTTLAQNLVEDGRCWRCGTATDKVEMDRWFIRETELAKAVLEQPAPEGWPKHILAMHDDWIGLSRGWQAAFRLKDAPESAAPFQVFAPGREDFSVARAIALPRDHSALWGRDGDATDLVAVSVCGRAVLPVEIQDEWDGDAEDARLVAGTADAGRGASSEPGLEPAVRTRLRDWDVARPRPWGTPVPIVHCPDCGAVPAAEADLPVCLPERFDAEAANPLTEIAEFVETLCPACGAPARRETDTMEAYSSPWWYYIVASTPEADDVFRSQGVDDWMPVDVMIGGADQVRTCFFHLRTLTVALTGMGMADETVPVRSLVAVGMVKSDNTKMSKSAGNVVEPTELLERYGADALRVAVLWAAAPDQEFNWTEALIRRAAGFLRKLRQFCDARGADYAEAADDREPGTRKLGRALDMIRETEAAVTGCHDGNAFHVGLTRTARLLDRLQQLEKGGRGDPDTEAVLRAGARAMLRMVYPGAPHLAEDLWAAGGGAQMIAALDATVQAPDAVGQAPEAAGQTPARRAGAVA